jgi:PHD/YefM family antitoxin component YafN of YafNO toxin-antitoxin module
MTARQLIAEVKKATIYKKGKKSVVVLSAAAWEKIEDYLEDLEMSQSRRLVATIKKARAEKKLYSPREVKKILGS